ncbi:MAG: FixH family protein [Bacteroidota bacterium]
MNWGRALLLVFVLFAGFMGYLVYRASGTQFDLVSKDYYRDELNYQEKIDGLRRAASISRVAVKIADNRQLLVELPAELTGKNISGELWLYCKTNAAFDLKLPMLSDTALLRSFDLSAHPPGKYLVKLHWEADQLKYDAEQEINLP